MYVVIPDIIWIIKMPNRMPPNKPVKPQRVAIDMHDRDTVKVLNSFEAHGGRVKEQVGQKLKEIAPTKFNLMQRIG